MFEVLINSFVLLCSIGVSFGALFWKSFAKRPGATVRAIVATIIGSIGLLMFFSYVALLTLKPEDNIITFIQEWLT